MKSEPNGGSGQVREFNNFREIADFLWSIADLLRGEYKQADYGKVILSMTVLRRLACVLRDTKQKVLQRNQELKGSKIETLDRILNKITRVPFHNVSKLDFEKLKGDPTNLTSYIKGFSKNIRRRPGRPCRG